MSLLNRYIILFVCALIVGNAYAQSDEYVAIHKGNKLYAQKQFKQAELQYKRALTFNPHSSRAYYDIGNALLMQGDTKNAITMYDKAESYEKNKKILARIYHNKAFIYHKDQKLDKAIEEYKKSLRNDPSNDDTRYNLSLCLYQMKNNKSPNKPNQEQKQNNSEDRQNKKQKQKQPQKQKGNQNNMSKQNAENLLNIVEREERNTQDKLKRNMRQPRSKQLDKNW